MARRKKKKQRTKKPDLTKRLNGLQERMTWLESRVDHMQKIRQLTEAENGQYMRRVAVGVLDEFLVSRPWEKKQA